MAIELVPLCTLGVQLQPPIAVGTGCAGTRLIFEVASVQVKGDRLRAEMTGAAAADWQLIGPEGTATLDVRATLRTDHGARSSSCSSTVSRRRCLRGLAGASDDLCHASL